MLNNNYHFITGLTSFKYPPGLSSGFSCKNLVNDDQLILIKNLQSVI